MFLGDRYVVVVLGEADMFHSIRIEFAKGGSRGGDRGSGMGSGP